MAGIDNEILIIENNGEASVWTQRYEEIFIELMKEEVLKGNRNTTTFTKQSWKHIKEKLCAQTKRNYSNTQLRNKFNQLRQKQKDFKSLLKKTGIGYSTTTGQVCATDEVWDKLIQDNKSAKRFRKKGCIFYEKLCIIFDDTTATGSNTHHSTGNPSDDDDSDANDDDVISKSPNRNQESSFDEDGSKIRDKSTTTSNSRSIKRVKFSSTLANAFVNETAKQKTKLLERSMTTSSSHYLLDESVEALNQIDGISGKVYAKAIEKFENEVSRALFLKMPKHRRIDWLLNLK